jgi:HlyD family secretion protein
MSQPRPTWNARVPIVIGFAAIALLVGSLGAWSVGTQIAGAVVAPGTVVVESDRQVVQHPDGGVVGEVLARDGDLVAAGDVLVRLDGTFLRSELIIVERQLAEIFARRARLEAEEAEADAPEFADFPEFTLIDAEVVAEQVQGQLSLFESRRAALEQERAQLTEQQRQVERQIEGIEAQLGALTRQLDLIAQELSGVQTLFDRGLVQAGRLLELQREEARLQGEIGRLISASAEAETRISSLEIESLKLGERRREEAITRLRDLQYSEIELQERRLSLVERLARLDVRSPVAGVVFGSRVFAVQSVIQPAEPMMYVVPVDQPLHISARIDPIDVDQVHAGQDVALMFSAFNLRTTPEIPGRVVRVSADAETDTVTGATFYEAIVVPDATALAALSGVTVIPGMPVETFLKTDNRTPLSYLVQPLSIYFSRAFREE